MLFFFFFYIYYGFGHNAVKCVTAQLLHVIQCSPATELICSKADAKTGFIRPATIPRLSRHTL